MADVYSASELRTLSAELASGKPLTAEVFIKLKATINQEISRRKYKGSIAEFAGGSWDYAEPPSEGKSVMTEHYSKLQGPMDKIYPMALPNPTTGNKNHELSALANRLADNLETSLTSGNDCASSCTGLCHTGCWKTCGNECSTNCSGDCGSGCSSSCTGECKESCDTGCKNTCLTGCNTTCKTTCSGGCIKGCGGECSSGCGSVCTESCTNSCAGECVGCTGSCQSGCTGTCKTTCTGSCKTGVTVSYS